MFNFLLGLVAGLTLYFGISTFATPKDSSAVFTSATDCGAEVIFADIKSGEEYAFGDGAHKNFKLNQEGGCETPEPELQTI